MSITDELRKWLKSLYTPNSATVKDEGEHIADRIDAEHERQCAESWMRGHDAWAAIDRGDEMAEHGWIRLPKDADGVPFRIGDEVDGDHYEDGTVAGIQFYEMANGGIRTLIAVRPDGWDVATWHTPDEYRRHHKQPTVEDVLFEFAQFWSDEELTDIEHLQPHAAQTIAEYAAKLQFKEDK